MQKHKKRKTCKKSNKIKKSLSRLLLVLRTCFNFNFLCGEGYQIHQADHVTFVQPLTYFDFNVSNQTQQTFSHLFVKTPEIKIAANSSHNFSIPTLISGQIKSSQTFKVHHSSFILSVFHFIHLFQHKSKHKQHVNNFRPR